MVSLTTRCVPVTWVSFERICGVWVLVVGREREREDELSSHHMGFF